MSITIPQLPPREGYVEVVDSDGNHVYAPTPETIKQEDEHLALLGRISTLETENTELKEVIDTMLTGGTT